MSHGVEIHIADATFSVFITERFHGDLEPFVPRGSAPALAAGTEGQIALLFPDNFRDKLLRVHIQPEISKCADPSPGRAVYRSGDLLLEENAGGGVYDLIQVPPGSYAIHLEESGSENNLDIYDLTLFDRQPFSLDYSSGPSTVT